MGRDDSGAGAVLMAFVLGALTGAAVALLWAPGPGDETRRYLQDRARESKQRASVAARQGRDFLDRQREHLSSAVERGKEAYQRARQEKEQA